MVCEKVEWEGILKIESSLITYAFETNKFYRIYLDNDLLYQNWPSNYRNLRVAKKVKFATEQNWHYLVEIYHPEPGEITNLHEIYYDPEDTSPTSLKSSQFKTFDAIVEELTCTTSDYPSCGYKRSGSNTIHDYAICGDSDIDQKLEECDNSTLINHGVCTDQCYFRKEEICTYNPFS